MVIKHIVLSGGAYLGFYQFGALQYLAKQGFYQHEDICSIYGTSVGSLMGVILCLHEDWNTINDYFIKRPWHKIIHITPSMVFDIIQKKGLLGKEFIDKIMLPLIKSVNLDETLTLQELYEFSNIELYLYTIDINTFKSVELSHHLFPDLQVLTALYMSCSLPYIFQPCWYNDTYYIDGGLLNSYPILNCIEKNGVIDEILSCSFNSKPCIGKIDQSTNIFAYGYFLYRNLVKKARQKEIPSLKNEIIIPCVEINIKDGNNILFDSDKRREYVEKGAECARLFLSKKEKNSI